MTNKLILLCILFNSFISYGQKVHPGFAEPQLLGFVLPQGERSVIIPFEIYNNLIVIDVILNGALPLKFVLDTGVRTTVLTEKTLTDLLNVNYARKITIPGAGGEKLVDAYVVNDVSLTIGAINGNGHALLVLENDLLQLKNYLGVNVHGVLGYELFSRFVIDVNYDSKIITIYDSDHYKKRRGFTEFDISIEDTKPYIEASYIVRDGITLHGKFLLDTGASHTMLLDATTSDDIYVPEPNIESALGRGLGGEVYGKVARIDNLWVGDFAFDDVIATFPDSTSYEVSMEHTFRNGTFGGGLMSRFHMVFDYVNSKLYVKRGKSYGKPFEFNLSGLIIRTSDVFLKEYAVDNVRVHSAAEEAGIKVGDEILMINGYKASKLDLNQVLGMLNVRANKSVKLVVLRDNERISFNFKLKRLI